MFTACEVYHLTLWSVWIGGLVFFQDAEVIFPVLTEVCGELYLVKHSAEMQKPENLSFSQPDHCAVALLRTWEKTRQQNSLTLLCASRISCLAQLEQI